MFKIKAKIKTLSKNYIEKNNYHNYNKLLACLDTVKSLHGISYQRISVNISMSLAGPVF